LQYFRFLLLNQFEGFVEDGKMGKYTVEMEMEIEKNNLLEVTMVDVSDYVEHQATYLLHNWFE